MSSRAGTRCSIQCSRPSGYPIWNDRQPVVHPFDAAETLYAGPGEVLRLHPEPWVPAGELLCVELPAQRAGSVEHPVQEQPVQPLRELERQASGATADQVGLVVRGKLQRYLRPRVSGTNDQDWPILHLRRIAVIIGVHLQD